MALLVAAPVAGAVTSLTEVPDPVFAASLVGPGLAVTPDPDAYDVAAPIDGLLVKVKPHAFVVQAESGQAVLVHLGIDTVGLSGEGFTLLAEEGATVRVGDPVIRWDPAAVAARGLANVCPVVALDAPADAVTAPAAGHVTPGAPLFIWS